VALTVAPATRGVPTLSLCAGADCQNLVDHDLLANVRSNLFYFNFFAGSNLVLFATGFYDRVHVETFQEKNFLACHRELKTARNYKAKLSTLARSRCEVKGRSGPTTSMAGAMTGMGGATGTGKLAS
jgi:hypothetical protein